MSLFYSLPAELTGRTSVPALDQSRKVRVLLVDDHSQLRGELAARLKRESDFDVVGWLPTVSKPLQGVQVNCPDLLLMDPITRDGTGDVTTGACESAGHSCGCVTAFIDTTLNIQCQEMGIKHILANGI